MQMLWKEGKPDKAYEALLRLRSEHGESRDLARLARAIEEARIEGVVRAPVLKGLEDKPGVIPFEWSDLSVPSLVSISR